MSANNLEVRWKHHQEGVMDYLRQLLVSEVFVDVTLCCQNKRFKAHRILLSSCSSYLQQVLTEHVVSDHVTIILPDIHPDDMQWLLDFMYTGSVAVPRSRLSSFLQAAEALNIKILTDVAQLQKTTDSCSVVSSPVLDFKLTKDPNFRKHPINSNTDTCIIMPHSLTEDCKNSSCRDDAKIRSDSSKLVTDKEDFKTVTEDSKSCVFMCSSDVSSYVPKGFQSPIDSHSISCKTTSLHDGLSRKPEIYETAKGEVEEPPRMGSAAVISGCDTKMTYNAEIKNSTSLGHPSEKPSPRLETPVHNTSPCDAKNAGNFNIDNSSSICIGNEPQADRECNDKELPSEEHFSSPEYGFKLNNRVIPSSISPVYRHDTGVIDLPLRHRPENAEHCTLNPQRLPQWPKPLPSLMPINNMTWYNGQVPACYLGKDCTVNGAISHTALQLDRKDTFPGHLQSMKNIVSNSEPRTRSMEADQHLPKEHRHVKNVWFYGTDKVLHHNGQTPVADCRPSRRPSHRVPRLCPIVPPSPWAQHHRPPCATPVACPPIAMNYPAISWTVPPVHVAVDQQPTPLLERPDNQQRPSDTARPRASIQAAKLSPTGRAAMSPPPQSSDKGPDETTPLRRRPSESAAMFCKLKSRRLEEFYREETARQLRTGSSEEEVASDLSTKSPQSPIRSTHLNSSRGTPEYRKVTSSPLTESLQQKLKTFSELSSPNLSICDEKLSYRENVKEDDNAKLEGCDKEAGRGEPKTDEAAPVLTDDRAQEPVVTGSEGERKDDYDVQVLHDARRTSFVKNDNNNNNNGLLEEVKQGDPIVKTHGCQDCGKCFSRRQLLVQHRRIHTGERPYSCAECGRQFTQRGHWSTHQKLHEPARRPEHACPSCGKAFVTRASLKVHLRTHTGEKPFQCGECGKQFSQLRNYKYHRSVHEGTREFAASCPECGKYFNDRGYLSSHMKIHRNRKEYGCQFCGKSFNQRVAYNMHVRIHTGERPHSCPHCSKSFSRKMLLKQHLRIHTGEKPFACSVCGKAFADRSNMTLHMRLHSGIKPYSCQLCAKAFTKKHHLKTHLNYHTGTKPYSCGKCGLRFSQSSNMRTHYKKCAGSGIMNLEAPVGKTEEATATPGTNNNGAVSPPSSPSRSDATMTSPETLSAPPHSNNSSCVTSVLPRNAVHAPLPV